MKNLLIDPNKLYLVDTKMAELEGPLFYPRVRIYPKRINVAVIYTFHRYFELERITSINLLRGMIPQKESFKEYVDTKTLRPFSHESIPNMDKVPLETLKKIYRKSQLVEYGNLSPFNIQRLYIGNIKKGKTLSSNYQNIESVYDNVCLLMNDEHRFITLQDFLEGKNNYISCDLERENQEYVDANSLKEVSLDVVFSSAKEYEKHLQFPKRTI